MGRSKKIKTSSHQKIVDFMLGLNVVFHMVDVDTFNSDYDGDCINFEKNDIYIRVCNEEIEWIEYGKRNFAASTYVDLEDTLNRLGLKPIKDIDFIDSYGSRIVDGELILNNWDIGTYPNVNSLNPKGFVDILEFASVDISGLVRYTNIVYSLLFKRIIIRDDLTYKLPFKPHLRNDFGGKRATYKVGCNLSLRTTLDVYKKVDVTYKQSDKHKDTLSYPRLILRECSIFNKGEL